MILAQRRLFWWPGLLAFLGLFILQIFIGSAEPTGGLPLFTIASVNVLACTVALYVHKRGNPSTPILGRFTFEQLLGLFVIVVIVNEFYHYARRTFGIAPVPIDVTDIKLVVLTTLIAPFLEEVMFRHFLISIIPIDRSPWIAGMSVIITSALFSMAHVQYLGTIPLVLTMFSMGLILGYARVISGGVLLPILLHSTWNAYVVIRNSI